MSGATADLEFGIRVRADASGLVGQVGQGEAALERLEGAAAQAGAGAQRLGAGTRAAAAELGQLKTQANAAEAAVRRTQSAAQGGVASNQALAASAGAARIGYQQLGFQMNDVVTQLASGTSITQVFAQQAGHVLQALALIKMEGGRPGAAGAVDELDKNMDRASRTAETLAQSLQGAGRGSDDASDKANRFANLLSGPWGAAMIAGVTILSVLIGKLFEMGKQSKEAARSLEDTSSASDILGEAQSALGDIFDLTTGKIKKQSGALREHIELMILEARMKALELDRKADDDLAAFDQNRGKFGEMSMSDYNSQLGAGENQMRAQARRTAGTLINMVYQQYERGVISLARAEAMLREDHAAGRYGKLKLTNEEQTGVLDLLYRRARAHSYRENAGAIRSTLDKGELDPSLIRPANERQRRERKPPEVQTRFLEDPDSVLARLGTRHTPRGAFRTPAQNRAVGGAPNSYHMRDQARDIPLGGGMTKERLRAAFEAAGYDVRQVLGPGDKGHHDHFHIAWNNEMRNGIPISRGKPTDAQQLAQQQFQEMQRLAEEAEKLREFGIEASQSIFEMVERFDTTPPAVKAMRDQLGELDILLLEIEDRGPPNYEQLLEQARLARPIIEDSINQPYRDFIGSQRESLELMRTERRFGADAAEARRAILDIERQMGPLSEERKADVLATVQALQAEQRQMEILRGQQQAYLGTLAETRSNINATIADVAGGDFEAILDLPNRLRETFNQLVADHLTETLFGGAFRKLQDQVTGVTIVEDASLKMAEAVERAAPPLDALGGGADGAVGPLERLAAAADRAAAAVDPESAAAMAWGEFGTGLVAELGTLFEGVDLEKVLGGALAAAEGVEEVITVTGERGGRRGPSHDHPGTEDWMPGDGGGPKFPRDPRLFFQNMLEELLQDAFGPKFAKLVGSAVSRGLEGAAYGSIVAGLLRSVGMPVNGTGAALGGALGNIAGEELAGAITKTFGATIGKFAGPLGSIAGSLVGGLLGNVISGPQKASATITSVDGKANVTGKAGLKGAAGSLGEAVQSGIGRIAEALGGQLGTFSVSIGKRGDSFRVDPLGRGQTKAKGVLAFDNEADAIAAAIADAIKDGAVVGLSDAVQKALRSSSDLDKALKEALKVGELEELLAGAAGELNKLFRDFERTAQERMRIARDYGFDLVKLEELNAKERAKIFEEAISSRVGQLQDLLDDLKFGDLFEGSVVDRRQALLLEIAKQEAAAKSGEEGAADRVAELRRELLELTRSGFGTAGGEFAADRSSTIASAEEIIRLETDRVKAAQDAALGTNQRLDKSNDLAHESNDLLAEQLAELRAIAGSLGSAPPAPSVGGGVSTGRQANLQ